MRKLLNLIEPNTHENGKKRRNTFFLRNEIPYVVKYFFCTKTFVYFFVPNKFDTLSFFSIKKRINQKKKIFK